MADPITLAILIGGGLTAGAQIQAGRAAKAQAETESDIAAYNARLKEAEAKAEQESAAAAAKQFAEEAEAITSRQRVLFAKGSVEPARGTPLSVIVKTAQELEADRLTILREGAISSAQRRAEAGIFKLRGGAAKARGKAAFRGSILSAGGTILTTVATAASLRRKGTGSGDADLRGGRTSPITGTRF